MPGEPSLTTRRVFHIARALLHGAATPQTLIAYVRAQFPNEDPYTGNVEEQFRVDCQRVGDLFGVFLGYNATNRERYVESIAPHGWFSLPYQQLETMALLRETFDDIDPGHDAIRALLAHITNLLPASEQAMLARTRTHPTVKLPSLDSGLIDDTLFAVLQEAVQKRRVIEFDYASARQQDGKLRHHRVEPHDLTFDDGHWYLYAYVRLSQGPYGDYTPHAHNNFRLTSIQADSIQVLPDLFSRRAEPTHELYYRLHPDLTRSVMSERFPDTTIVGQTEWEGAQWTDCRATIRPSQEFRAAQLFLRYGRKCHVLAPDSLVAKIRNLVTELAARYEVALESDPRRS